MIQVLPVQISNLIAAGEVVQRPASVVKELVENAVDAGAANIQVIISDSGRTLIQVIDDGCGMSPEDAQKCFLRHATSKISTAEDLNQIKTFGFRGEALASICSVAEVTLRTKRKDDQTGFEVKFAESKLLSTGAVSTPDGCNFIVRNLFYNVPARRKFLKTDSTEFRQILADISRIAITRPNISFRLTHNNNQILNLPPAPLKKRILDTAGKDLGRELVDINVKTSLADISGFIGKPEDARKTPGFQYLFANRRYFRSPYFQKAILKAYSGLIPEGTLPSFFIFFETDPQKIDVNIHPSKTEIKFEDDSALFDILYSATRESLGKNSFMPSIDFDMEGAPDIPRVNTNRYVPEPKIDYDPLFNPFNESPGHSAQELEQRFHTPYQSQQEEEVLFRDTSIPGKPVLQISGRYIMTTIKTGVILIDIKRARERILYEKYLSTLSHGNGIFQQTLFPVKVEAGANTISILKENQEALSYLGFDITFGEESLTFGALPQGFCDDTQSIDLMIDSLVEELSQNGQDFKSKDASELAERLARAGTAGNTGQLNTLEAQTLVDTLFACSQPGFTPSGKSCMKIIPTEDLAAMLQ